LKINVAAISSPVLIQKMANYAQNLQRRNLQAQQLARSLFASYFLVVHFSCLHSRRLSLSLEEYHVESAVFALSAVAPAG
jgi:hypothetical protein